VSGLPGLTPVDFAHQHAGLETAQRFLAGAYDSVDAVLDNLSIVRKARSAETRGRLTDSEVDLLRAAIVFAGAGVDAALKQLIRDALPPLLLFSEEARSKFTIHAQSRLESDAGRQLLARWLIASSSRDALIEDYIRSLTGSSLQSAEQVQLVAGALAITDATLRRDISQLRDVFVARNEIAHELDLREPSRHGDKRRRPRTITATTSLCHRALDTTQRMINAVGLLLTSPSTV
jgi:hypothetical protein